MLDEKTKIVIKKIIFRHFNPLKDKAFIFGSRALGKAKKFSDIDIGILSGQKVPWAKLSLVEEELENSDLPYTVDVVDFRTVSDRFKKIAAKKIINLN